MKAPLHKVAGFLMACGLAINLLAAHLGRRTLCSALRDHSHAETRRGQGSLVLTSVGALVLWLVHILDPKKRPVR